MNFINRSSSDDSGSSKQKNISGLNFRQIKSSIADEPDSNYNLQLDNLTEEGGYAGPDFESSKPFNKLGEFFLKIKIFQYIYDLSGYVYMRMRVVFILTSVFAEVMAKYFESIKRFIIRKMFLGRGNLLRFSLQFVGVFILAVVIISSSYRNQIPDSALAAVNPQVATAEIAQYQDQDLLVQNSSSKTVINRDIGRVEPEEYIVKGGDTVSSIAALFELTEDTILWANDLSKEDTIKPGDKLKIPPDDGVLIVVKDGDSLESLAKKYGANEQLIITANWWLDAPFNLEKGQELFIPGGVLPVEERKSTTVAAATTTYNATKPNVSTGTTRPIQPVNAFLGWPVANGGGTITAGRCAYGYHNGIDISANGFPPLVAAAGGTVTFAGCQSGSCPRPPATRGGTGLAWTVIIDHGNGLSTIYGHMNAIYVTSGQQVAKGQVIGQMGESGLAFGTHVHFMVVRSGTWTWLNPILYMEPNAKLAVCGG